MNERRRRRGTRTSPGSGAPERLGFALFCLTALGACAHTDIGAPPADASTEGHGHWVASWGASPQPADPPLPIAGQTVRQIVRISLGGSRVRVRLSNTEGTTALHVGSAHLAIHGKGPSIVSGSDRGLTFSGSPDVIIPPGALAVSDPVALSVPASSDLAVSIHLPDPVVATTEHSFGQTTYVSSAGDFSGADTLESPKTTDAWYFLAGVEVEASSSAHAIVALGDSLTDGMNSTMDANHRWPDFLAERLNAARRASPHAVVNEGISGNCVLRELVGASALARLDRDVLAQPGVKYVIVLEGTNDIGGTVTAPEQPATVDQIIAGYQQIILRAHARGLKVLGGTLPPFEGMSFPGFSSTPAGNAKREAVNRWIRTSGAYDAVIDFDRATRDPAHPSRLLPAFDSGDHGHPNDAGYKAMADAVDLSSFDDAPP